MSLPQSRLLTRLLALPAVTAIVGAKVFAELVPGPPDYPAVVFKVLSDEPVNDANGGSNSYTMKLQVSCLAIGGQGSGPYTRVWALAAAVRGDAENSAGPTGLSGWKDAEGSVWHLIDSFDEAGEIREGTNTFWAFVVNQLYTVQYVDPTS